MNVWRLCRAAFTALDGEGGRRHANRWNSAGQPVIYAAATLSLALLESLVHTDSDLLPPDLVSMCLAIPGDAHPTIQPEELPDPELGEWYRARGDSWLASRSSLALLVPSVIVPLEQNVLLNPAHQDMAQVRVLDVRPFRFDARLL